MVTPCRLNRTLNNKTKIVSVLNRHIDASAKGWVYMSQLSNEYDSLFKSRFHGAANISGIKYQILYSILRAFELYENKTQAASITLEGIEDVDIEIKSFKFFTEYGVVPAKLSLPAK